METRFSKYEPIFGSWYIKDKLGQGAAGEVLLIEREDLGNTYRSALKCITIPQSKQDLLAAKADGMTDDDVKAYYQSLMNRIKSELLNMSRMKGNSNIVSYEDHMIVPHEDGIGWDIMIRMELLTPLFQYCDEIDLTPETVLKMGIDLCKALELCANNGIIHRDIKPDNIFVSSNGDFKLGDFGVSRVLEETRIGLSLRGTYTYMAPEVYKGEAYGPRTDIYSLGLVLYKFLNGGRNVFLPAPGEPFTQEDEDRAFFRRMSGAAVQPPADGSDAFQSIVLKACAYRPDDRFQTAREMRLALEELDYRRKYDDAKAKEPAEEPVTVEKEEPKAAAITEEAIEPKKKRLSKEVIVAFALVAAAVVALVIYATIPKEVTNVTGIDATEELFIGDTLKVKYDIEPDRFEDEPMTFASSDEKVLTVDKTGALTGVSVGEATMTLKVKEFTKSVDVKVVPKVTEISGVDSSLTIYRGDTYDLDPKLAPEKFSKEPISYTSSDKDIATVNKDGLITAAGDGTATISIDAGGCGKQVEVSVTERPTSPPSYSSSGSKSSKKSSRKSKKKSGGSKGSFSSGDDEYF